MKLLALSHGDSHLLSTWSNVPYLFLSSFEKLEGESNLVRLNIRPEGCSLVRGVRLIYNILGKKISRFCTFERSILYKLYVNRKVKNVLEADQDITHILVFDLSTDLSIYQEYGLVTCMIGDWTIEYAISQFEHRLPIAIENKYIKRQERAINSTTFVFSLLPNSYLYNSQRYSNFYYLGNAANIPNGMDVFPKHNARNKILFIGKEQYRSGLLMLIRAVKEINYRSDCSFIIDVVGMDLSAIEDSSFINWHGYLSKDVEQERIIYYKLLTEATVLCNTTDNWSSAQSLLEALAVGLPIIVNPNKDLKLLLGDSLEFGWYCDNTTASIQACLSELCMMSNADYFALCEAAIDASREYTWDNVVNRWIDTVT